MTLMTARPWKHPTTGAYFIRQRTPLDLLHAVKGRAVSLPVGDGFVKVKVGDAVQASLRTKDAAEARSRHAIADGALKRFWEAQRNGPTKLTHRQITALSGFAYASLTGVAGDEPGSPEIWGHVLRIHATARAAGKLDRWVGPSVDEILAEQGLVVDEASRARLIEAVDQAFVQAAAHLKRNAQGDYRPDPDAGRFPEWQPASPIPASTRKERITVEDLFERWASYNADKKAPNTIKRYRGSFRSLIQFAKDREIRSLTGDDLYAWAQHREKVEGITAKAINKNDLVAVSSVFSWGASRQGGAILSDNPVRGVRLDEPRTVAKRERTFREQEIAAILAAASAVKPSDSNPTLHHALRWCPWLAAYSGARITELTHLEARDIRVEGGATVMDLRVTKTGIPRTVPIHEHLIEQGFLRFVKEAGSGPLFYDPARHTNESTTSPAEQRGHKVAKWVREAAKLDPDVDPNHGWRHTWKTRALGAGIEERLRDAITGHSVRSVGRRYEAPSLTMLAKAMTTFPRYVV
jgi:integrase